MLQDLLGVDARMQSVSAYAVSACGEMLVDCGKLAPSDDASGDLNVTLLDVDYLPYVDGIALDAASEVAQTFAFSASTDPGEQDLVLSAPKQASVPVQPLLCCLAAVTLQMASPARCEPRCWCRRAEQSGVDQVPGHVLQPGRAGVQHL